jgi:hypothetical protein
MRGRRESLIVNDRRRRQAAPMVQDDSRPGAVSPNEIARAKALLESPRRNDGAWAALAAAAFAAATSLALAAAVILAPPP